MFRIQLIFLGESEQPFVVFKIRAEDGRNAAMLAFEKQSDFNDPRSGKIGDCCIVQTEKRDYVGYFIFDKSEVAVTEPKEVSQGEFEWWRRTQANNPMREFGINAAVETNEEITTSNIKENSHEQCRR